MVTTVVVPTYILKLCTQITASSPLALALVTPMVNFSPDCRITMSMGKTIQNLNKINLSGCFNNYRECCCEMSYCYVFPTTMV